MAGHEGTPLGEDFTVNKNGPTKLPSFCSCLSVVLCAIFMLNVGFDVKAAPVTATTNETMIVAQTLLVGGCVDNIGADVADLAEWTTGCNRIVCHVEPSGNYTITHGCRTLVPSENPDSSNCVSVENTGATYPACCPYLSCAGSQTLTTASPLSCFDISDASTCAIWSDMSTNCTDSTSDVYNFTLTYCRQTCGFCTVSG